MRSFYLFIDLDGVLCDFDEGVRKLTSYYPEEVDQKYMWSTIARSKDFYANLEWTRDGKELWTAVQDYNPIILTGLPRGQWAEPQKRTWCARELGAEIPVITCMSREKAQRAKEHMTEDLPFFLIDDRENLKDSWLEMGGVFIHHRSTKESLKELSEIIDSTT